MKSFLKNNRQGLTAIFAIWYAIGATISLIVQYPPDNIPIQHRNCIYTSLSGFMNPGYWMTCELLRERFLIGEK